ncbi:MAG: hypothetical protein LBU87_01370 [Lactobacillales bacterium]|jgi:hypothetical protein|nr:hypothetical protein [Lactobacillales bacterium]
MEPKKAPPLPPQVTPPAFTGEETPAVQPQQPETVTTVQTEEPVSIVEKLPPVVFQPKVFWSLIAGLVVVGIFIGATLFGGSAPPPPAQGNPFLVVKNPDINARDGLRRCGMIDKGRACVLYIVNHTTYDKTADEFFDEAVKLTQAPRYSISMVNPKYAKTRIPPGYFAEIKIPNIN